MPEITIPPKTRPEWGKLITGQIEHQYQNYVLQTKTYQMHKDVKNGILSKEQAIDDLFTLCNKYALAVQNDFKQIFKTW
jgi:hypothetical protein